MDLKTAMQSYGDARPENRNIAKRISLALRREGIYNMEALQEAYFHDRGRLEKLRGIGPMAMNVIENILQFFERAPE